MGLISSILQLAGPLVVFLIKLFIRKADARAKAVASFYKIIAIMDAKSESKVRRHLEAEAALEKLQRELREQNEIEPERPAVPAVKNYEVPEIIDLDVEIKTRGQYLTKSGRAKGLVVHYTAGRFRGGRKDALGTLNSLAKRGLGCLVMDANGQIYKAKNQSLKDIAYHAGKSAYLGHTGMSRYCYGLEICNAGKLEADFTPWYGGPPIGEENRRRIASKRSNQKEGTYHKFTAAQEKSLLHFILWQLDVNPDFSIDFVIGHDECAPDRKSDPGGALSMTMPDFRAMINAI